jgi:hypothetical protein
VANFRWFHCRILGFNEVLRQTTMIWYIRYHHRIDESNHCSGHILGTSERTGGSFWFLGVSPPSKSLARASLTSRTPNLGSASGSVPRLYSLFWHVSRPNSGAHMLAFCSFVSSHRIHQTAKMVGAPRVSHTVYQKVEADDGRLACSYCVSLN